MDGTNPVIRKPPIQQWRRASRVSSTEGDVLDALPPDKGDPAEQSKLSFDFLSQINRRLQFSADL